VHGRDGGPPWLGQNARSHQMRDASSEGRAENEEPECSAQHLKADLSNSA
jgi:hypothetical protein